MCFWFIFVKNTEMKTASLYKSAEAHATLMRLYDEKLASIGVDFESVRVDTPAGETHVLAAGKVDGPAVVVFHGINAGAPLALEAMKGLLDTYRLYGVDTIGQATRSAATRLPLNGPALGDWAAAVMEGLGLASAHCVGVSYGGFLLQKLMQTHPDRVKKGILVVPGGLVNGPFFPSMRLLTFPLMRFLRTKRDEDLKRFLAAFYEELDTHSLAFQRAVLLGFKMDYRRPPLLKLGDVDGLSAPVFGIFAEEDVFFPGPKALARCQAIFPHFTGFHMLKSGKHIPSARRFLEIEQKIREWLG